MTILAIQADRVLMNSGLIYLSDINIEPNARFIKAKLMFFCHKQNKCLLVNMRKQYNYSYFGF